MRRAHCVPPRQPVCLNIAGKAKNCLFVSQTSLNWNYLVWVGRLPPPRGFLILPEFLPSPQPRGWGGDRAGVCAGTGQAVGRGRRWKWLLVNPGSFLGGGISDRIRSFRSWCELCYFQCILLCYSLAFPVTFWFLSFKTQGLKKTSVCHTVAPVHNNMICTWW